MGDNVLVEQNQLVLGCSRHPRTMPWVRMPWARENSHIHPDFGARSRYLRQLMLAKYSLTSYLSYNRQNCGILLKNCLCTKVLISIAIVMCVCASVCEC